MHITLQILKFDSLYGGLTWDERIFLHYWLSGRDRTCLPSDAIMEIESVIKKNQWQPPEMRFMKDEVGLYCEDPETITYISKEQYLMKYPKPQ